MARRSHRMLILGGGVVLAAGIVTAAMQPDGPGARPAEPAALAAPVEAHAKLTRRAGEWATRSSLTFPDMPDSNETTTGRATITVALGGRFIHESSTGTMMSEPYSGFRVTGYNTASGKYESVWTYTGSTSMMAARGASVDGGDTITYEAHFDAGPPGQFKFEIIERWENADSFTVTLVAKQPDGRDGSRLVTQYQRVK